MMLRSTPEKMVELNNVMVVWIGNPDLSVGLELKKSFVHLAQWVRHENVRLVLKTDKNKKDLYLP